jgi:hypothetical protein
MTFKRAIGKPNAEQQSRQDRCRAAGCIHCRLETRARAGHVNFYNLQVFGTGMPVEIHHQTYQGRQLGQDETVASCSWHHRAICLPNVNSTQMLNLYGPSLAKGSKPFTQRYGTNAEQLDYQNALIGEGDDAD